MQHQTKIVETVWTVDGQLRKALKTRGHLPNDDAALKLLYLELAMSRLA